MNREIKFRGKHIETNEWVYEYLVIDTDGNVNYIVERAYWNCEECSDQTLYYEVDPKTVGQYIGLDDKNNKAIYEGDIVVKHYKNSIIRDEKRIIGFLNGSFVYTNIPKINNQTFNTFSLFHTENGSAIPEEWERIGNIYDNPESIK